MNRKLVGWILIGLLVVFLIVMVRGYIVSLQESKEDKEIKREIERSRQNL